MRRPFDRPGVGEPEAEHGGGFSAQAHVTCDQGGEYIEQLGRRDGRVPRLRLGEPRQREWFGAHAPQPLRVRHRLALADVSVGERGIARGLSRGVEIDRTVAACCGRRVHKRWGAVGHRAGTGLL